VTEQTDWASQLGERIEEAGGKGLGAPKHVMARLTRLLYPAAVEYVDVQIKMEPGKSEVDGRFAVFTDELVAVVVFKGLRARQMPDPSHHQHTAVDVKVVSRRALTRIEMPQHVEGSGQYNSSASWQDTDKVFSLPWDGRVALQYVGLDERIVAPAGGNAEEFERFLPSLLADLNR